MSITDDTLVSQDKLELDFWALRREAIKYNHENNYEEAVKYLDMALEINPNAVDMLYDKAMVLYKMGDYRRAKIWLKKHLDRDAQNIYILHKYFKCIFRLSDEMSDDDIDLLLVLSKKDELYKSEIQMLKAVNADIEKIKEIRKNSKKTAAQNLSEELDKMSVDNAKQYIDTLTTDTKRRTRVFCDMLFRRELFEYLFEFLGKEIDNEPEPPDNYLLIAFYKNKLGLYYEAIEILTKYNSINPKLGYVYTNDELTKLYIQVGEIDEAMKRIKTLESYLKKKEGKGEKFAFYRFRSLSVFYNMLGDDENSEYYNQLFQSYKTLYRKSQKQVLNKQ